MQHTNFDNVYKSVMYNMNGNSIHEYITQELSGMYFDTLDQVIQHLQSAACAHGSWSGVIYNRDIEEKLDQRSWRLAIEVSLADYADNMGESYTFNEFSQALWFAIEWEAHNIARYLESVGQVHVVISAIDALDPNPERIAFADYMDAEEFVTDEIARRVNYIVEHSQHEISDEEFQHLQEIEAQLVRLEEDF